jgi:type IX secretion system PorP/SprF family membrane protein
MKKLLLNMFGLLFATMIYAQQLPLSENYFVDRYSLSSAYVGNSDNKNLFASYRRDWIGLVEGPRTSRLSYHDGFKNGTGLGGKIIMDKFGIFESFYAMGTYSYRVEAFPTHFVYFGLSAGLHQNSINLTKYYTDQTFSSDPSVVNMDVSSNLGFVSDFSVVYAHSGFEGGFSFSNFLYSAYSYESLNAGYDPFLHYQLHAIYKTPIANDWELTPLLIFRGGKSLKSQLEEAVQVKYQSKIWVSIGHRGSNVYSAGVGAHLGKGILFNYTHNFFTDTRQSAFQNQELTLGLNIAEFLLKREK